MKKLAEQLKNGDKIAIGPETLKIESIEISDVGKQGVKKCRIVALRPNGDKVILVRPSNYPFDTK